MFSKTCEYAIRAAIYIAQHSRNGERVGIKEIAKGIGSPEHFIAKILQDLSKKGLILSFKGPTGGFSVDQESECSLADIVKAVDGDKILSGCGLGLDFCSEAHPCPLHAEFKRIREDFSDMLHKARLVQFSDQLNNQLTFLRVK